MLKTRPVQPPKGGAKHEFVLAGLKGFALIKAPATDEVGWIAFKLNSTRAHAAKAIKAAREWEQKVTEAAAVPGPKEG